MCVKVKFNELPVYSQQGRPAVQQGPPAVMHGLGKGQEQVLAAPRPRRGRFNLPARRP